MDVLLVNLTYVIFLICKVGGIRFLYDNLVESLERYKSSSGFGCILAHSMGLGKTLQVISFIDILLRHTGAHTVLAIVPVSIGPSMIISMLLLCTHTCMLDCNFM